jgi:hypothetical protein
MNGQWRKGKVATSCMASKFALATGSKDSSGPSHYSSEKKKYPLPNPFMKIFLVYPTTNQDELPDGHRKR